ncbi:MAG TPA: phosphatase PAP2 family protein [Xanthomonadales bacterium]|nr:phosphatase PAP2 family protein [Xanthomonadales bacterium]
MSRNKIFFFSGVFLFFLFILFSFLVHKNLFTNLDFNATVRLQDNIPRRLDSIFSIFSDIGKFEISTIVLILILAFSRKFIAGISTMVLYVGFHFIELFGKFFVNHPPPPEFLLRTERIMNFPQFHVRSEFSYPSGHAGRTLFLSVILMVLILQSKISKWLKIGLVLAIFGYNAVMFVSRVYLGEHWMTDVVGGAILGGAIGLIGGGLLSVSFKQSKSKPEKVKS